MVNSDIRAVREKVVKPALHKGYILAPTINQQLWYKAYLSVYGNDMVLVPMNMKTLIENSHVCYPSSVEQCSLNSLPGYCAGLVE